MIVKNIVFAQILNIFTVYLQIPLSHLQTPLRKVGCGERVTEQNPLKPSSWLCGCSEKRSPSSFLWAPTMQIICSTSVLHVFISNSLSCQILFIIWGLGRYNPVLWQAKQVFIGSTKIHQVRCPSHPRQQGGTRPSNRPSKGLSCLMSPWPDSKLGVSSWPMFSLATRPQKVSGWKRVFGKFPVLFPTQQTRGKCRGLKEYLNRSTQRSPFSADCCFSPPVAVHTHWNQEK